MNINIILPDGEENGHASKGSSSAQRHMECPVSYILSKGLAGKKTSTAAKKGTFQHTVNELILPDVFYNMGQCTIPFDISVNDEKYYEKKEQFQHAVNNAKLFFSKCEPYLQYEHRILLEAKLICSEERDIWGTGDMVFICDTKDCIKIIIQDYKNGVGVVVDYAVNWQLIQYLGGALNEVRADFSKDLPLCPNDLVIYQPNASDEPFEQTFSFDEAKELIDRLNKQYLKIEAWEAKVDFTDKNPLKRLEQFDWKDDDFKAGKHCKFCKASLICPKKKEHDKVKVAKLLKDVSQGKKFPGSSSTNTRAKQQSLIKQYVDNYPEQKQAILELGLKRSQLTSLGQACYDFCRNNMEEESMEFEGYSLAPTKTNDSFDLDKYDQRQIINELSSAGLEKTHTVIPEKIKLIGMTQLKKNLCLLYTSPSPRDKRQSRMPSSA